MTVWLLIDRQGRNHIIRVYQSRMDAIRAFWKRPDHMQYQRIISDDGSVIQAYHPFHPWDSIEIREVEVEGTANE